MTSNELEDILKKMCRDEFEAYHIYKFLGNHLRAGEDVRNLFKRASEDEWGHYQILSEIVGKCESSVSKFKVLVFALISLVFGTTVTLKLVESLERKAKKSYSELVGARGELSKRILKLVNDEERHELDMISNLNESRVKYLSSIALGVSDALVELTGIYAGALGVLTSTSSTGLIGVLAGISAALSMSVASYTQAKQEVGKSPRLAALFTGLSYSLVVIALALPYFLTASKVIAFSLMLIIALTLIAYMSFYSSVLHGRKYLKEFAENSLLLLGVAFLLYFLGNLFSIASG
ncbi:MAG: ferritin family protein [Sulfolobales archaeon]